MDEVTFGILLLFGFLLGLFGRSVSWRVMRAIGIQSGDQRRCRFDEPISINAGKGQDFIKSDARRSDEPPILGGMWFYAASNDERDMQIYDPTPLQDVDPQNLA
ncbi:MAG: hypothetical protein LBT63_00650 [Holosporaceae bacterium]|jgi:hypothetical protein|nr:hypothetical protein [Holosporaceae bacterium]